MLRKLTEDNPKRFAVVFAIMLVMLLTSVGTLNYVVNPMAQYPSRLYKPMAQTSRSQKLELFKKLPETPQGLILGSSRVMKLEPDYLQKLTGKRFFNAGVNYATPEDHLAWLRLYQLRFECPPEIVIVGIDPSSFSSNLPPDARLINNRELADRIPEAITWSDRMKLWEELFSWDQTKKSVKSLAMQTLHKQLPAPAEHYRDDGLLVYDVREREIREGTYDLNAGIDYNKAEYFPRYRNFGTQSLQRRQLFRELAKTCQANGTRLYVYITPMHPELEAYLLQKTEYLQRRDETAFFLKTLANTYGYEFFDFAKLESFGGDQNQFVDGTHPLESNTQRMLNIMFSAPQLAEDPQATKPRPSTLLSVK